MGDDVETGATTALTRAGVTLPDDPELKGALKPVPEMTCCERVAGCAAVASVVTALLLMVFVGGVFSNIAGVGAILIGPYFYWQQTELTNIRVLGETGEAVHVEVEKLKAENDRLKESIEELGSSVEELKNVEEALAAVTASSGDAIADLERSVQEAKSTVENQKNLSKGRVMMNILEVFERADESGGSDGIISEKEADKCVDSLHHLTGLSFKEEKLKELVVGKTLDAIAELIKNLTHDDIPEEENVFTLGDKTVVQYDIPEEENSVSVSVELTA